MDQQTLPPVFPMPPRAGRILKDRFTRVRDEQGREEAVLDLRQILTLGVAKVVERTKGRSLNDAQRRIVEAVHAGRNELMVEEISAEVQDRIRENGGAYLTAVTCAHGTLPFLPDALIPADEKTARAWRRFLDALEPRCLRVEDPLTRLRGRVPFRDGAWLADLVYRPNAPALLPPGAAEIRGDLLLRGHAPADPGRVALRGALYIDADELKAESLVESLSGRMRLYSETARNAEDLEAGPERLAAWGAVHGTPVLVNDRAAYRLHVQATPEGPVRALVESPGGRDIDVKSMRLVWDGNRWKRFSRELPPETAYALQRKFRRICALLGLGEDFIETQRDIEHTVDVNAARIGLLLGLGRGDHSPREAKNVPAEARKTIDAMRERLIRLRDLTVGEGAEYYRDVELVAAEIGELLDEFSDGRITRLAEAMSGNCRPIDRTKLKADADFLRGLDAEDLTLGRILGTAGRTLVFVNNLCISKEMRSQAADAVSRVRGDLKAVLRAKPSQDLLLNLLKFSDDKALGKLRRGHAGSEDAVADLAAHLAELNARDPLELLRAFRDAPMRTVTPEVEADRRLLKRCLSLHRGGLDDIFRRAEPGYGLEDGRILQVALMVNMRSFLGDHLRTRPFDLDADVPSDQVAAVLETVERYRSVIPQFNRVCAGQDD